MGIHNSESGQNQLIAGQNLPSGQNLPGGLSAQHHHHHRKSNSNSVNSHAVMSGKQQINLSSGSGIGNMKFVKPSELSLDLISPSSNLRNMGIKRGNHSGTGGGIGSNSIHNQTTLTGGSPSTSAANQNMKNIL